jgi:hypothetical protein
MTDQEERLKKAWQHDVNERMRFRCLIGKTEATLSIMIEPDPHGDERGTHAHFHTIITCPNIKIVDLPEPDRCRITDNTCPFIAPLGSSERSPELRKLGYAHDIIQKMAFIEFYGSQLVNAIFSTKGLASVQENLRVAELSRIMIMSDLVDNETYDKINRLRRIRNKLAHNPKQHLKFSEKQLFEWSMEARELSSAVAKLLESKTSDGSRKGLKQHEQKK